jgi:glycosyltransferase involved in cell wall biosynthesis
MADTPKYKILWLNSDRWACGVYRCYVPALSLLEQGFMSYFLEHKETFEKRTFEVNAKQLEGIDLVVVQRAFMPPVEAFVTEAKARGIAVVYEVDDDLFHIPRHNPSYGTWADKRVRQMTRRLVQMADAVTVSTPTLRHAFAEACDVSVQKITVCKNHLHPDVWGAEALGGIGGVTSTPDTRCVIGWQGSATHDHDFTTAVPALARILDTFPHTVLRLFGAVPSAIKGKIPVSRFEWMKGVEFNQYPRNLAASGFTIGLAPLAETKFNLSKSSVKVLDYAAVRVPTIASPSPAYAETVRHGETGFLASTTDEWYEALLALVMDPARCRAMGQAAHDHAWAQWGPEAQSPAWTTLFTRLMEAR